jgi:hypothetical protein
VVAIGGIEDVVVSTVEVVGAGSDEVAAGGSVLMLAGVVLLDETTDKVKDAPGTRVMNAACDKLPSLREDCPLNVTREFCPMQERFSALSFDSMTVPERGIEKLALEAAMRRGIALPRVTSSMESSDVTRVVVVHALLLSIVQVAPEKPFVHMQEHTPCVMTLTPPF